MEENLIDEIGPWSEVKLDIVKEYASAYSTIFAAQANPKLYHIYVDAFAGSGVHLSRDTQKFIPGSPLNALNIKPPFCEYYYIDIDNVRIKALEELSRAGSKKVYIYEGDCNEILVSQVFPRIQYKEYRCGLCLLDPYGLHLDWEVVKTSGEMKTIEIFLNFPIMDMNRNVFLHDQGKVKDGDIVRMNRFWGDDSWHNAVYSTQGNLFGFEEKTANNEAIAEAYRQRLLNIAGFSYVPEPMPMRNSKGAIVYYLFFASPKPVAAKIVNDIFNKYRNK